MYQILYYKFGKGVKIMITIHTFYINKAPETRGFSILFTDGNQ